jgi:hypothetical protein
MISRICNTKCKIFQQGDLDAWGCSDRLKDIIFLLFIIAVQSGATQVYEINLHFSLSQMFQHLCNLFQGYVHSIHYKRN